MIIIEMNTQMRNDSTYGLHCLNPIDTSSSILLTLSYLNQNMSNVDVFAVTDKLNQLNLSDKPDLNLVEKILQGVRYL